MTRGYIYVLGSNRTPYLKIGRSNRLPYFRLKEVNRQIGYADFQPWEIVDFVDAQDATAAETYLHRTLRDRHVRDHLPASELFRITRQDATDLLNALPVSFLAGMERISRLQHDQALTSFLRKLMQATGLSEFITRQGLWTLSLYPSTAGGRLFTLNIAQHEVAYASVDEDGKVTAFFVVDAASTVRRSARQWRKWAKRYDSRVARISFRTVDYKSASPEAVGVQIITDLPNLEEMLEDTPFRRSLLSYWLDHLFAASERNTQSLHTRSHNSNAVRYILNADQASRRPASNLPLPRPPSAD